MSLARRLQRWWDDLLGRPSWYRDPGTTITRSALETGSRRKQSQATDGLELAEDSPQTGRRTHRSAGVDPYSNDAGYAKPHSWERIDHD